MRGLSAKLTEGENRMMKLCSSGSSAFILTFGGFFLWYC